MLSTLFRIRELTHPHHWLVALWLTGMTLLEAADVLYSADECDVVEIRSSNLRTKGRLDSVADRCLIWTQTCEELAPPQNKPRNAWTKRENAFKPLFCLWNGLYCPLCRLTTEGRVLTHCITGFIVNFMNNTGLEHRILSFCLYHCLASLRAYEHPYS